MAAASEIAAATAAIQAIDTIGFGTHRYKAALKAAAPAASATILESGGPACMLGACRWATPISRAPAWRHRSSGSPSGSTAAPSCWRGQRIRGADAVVARFLSLRDRHPILACDMLTDLGRTLSLRGRRRLRELQLLP